MAGMAGLRVAVDLSAYFKDYRQKSLIYIDRDSIKSVQHLIDHICKIFCVDDNVELFISDAHVPRSECAGIIREGDIVRIEKVVSQPDAISQSGKKKKRKAHKSEEVELEIISENQVCESLSSNVTAEPRKKKRKPVDCSPTKSCEASTDIQTLKSKSKKGRRKMLVEDPNEWSKYICEKVIDNESNALENSYTTVTEIPSELDIVHKSTPITKNNQLASRQIENNSVENVANLIELQSESIEEKSLTDSNLLNESAITGKGISVTLDETQSCGINSGSTKRRRRVRRRKKSRREGKSKRIDFIESNPPGCKAIVTERKMEGINNKHIRFPDEDYKGKEFEISLGGNSKNLVGVCASSIVSGDSLHVEVSGTSLLETAEEECMYESILEENNTSPEEPTNKFVDCSEEKQVCQGKGKDSNVHGVVINNDKNNGHEISADNESVVMENESHDNVISCCNSDRTTIESSPDLLSKPVVSSNGALGQSKRNRRRNVIIAMGLGETLSQLIKESNKSNKKECIPHVSNSLELLVNKPVKDIEVSSTKNQKEKRYGGFPVLESFPRRGDILAFKVLKLNERYEPIISGYLEGKILDFDSTSTLVTLKVLGGGEELKKTNGKFDITDEEEHSAVEYDAKNHQETLQLQWKEFIEPRLVFP
ncbi:uncharacterized protein coil [Hetaerina americana]|uniref:uncharacterized protein coil n=1 Tax=Hetaerina americana TaxID=62018 RepID=UPI003A7F2251